MVHRDDPSSLSNPLEIRVKSSHLSLSVDFTKKILAGNVQHKVQVTKEIRIKQITELISSYRLLKSSILRLSWTQKR